MEDHDPHLREKAKLLLQRERELFELRLKHEQTAVWLSIGQDLPELFLSPSASLGEVWDRVRKILVIKLRLQRVIVLEVQQHALRQLAPARPELPPSLEVCGLLRSRPSGLCNDPGDEQDVGVTSLARNVGLHRFIWCSIAGVNGASIVIAAGFDETKAAFQSPFVSSDAGHFSNAAQHIALLLGNALLIAELEQEKTQLRQANVTLKHRDRELHGVAEQLRAANETLEQRVSERTLELGEKNRELRLVLDNVDQALLTVDLEGRLAPERSSVVDRWFGPYAGTPLLTEHLSADRNFADMFTLGLAALRDDFLPSQVSLAQMPQRLILGQRHFDCRYLPIEEGTALVALLIVVDDITEELERAREEAIQRETLAVFSALMRDRSGFLLFFRESEQMLEQLSGAALDAATRGQLLHTLKGNAASLGLHVIADLCHRAESELANGCDHRPETLAQLRTRWSSVVQTLHAVVPARLHKTLEISEQELASFAEQARQGFSATQIVEALESLRREPVERPLRRLAQQAHAVAARLLRPALDVEVDADDIRLDQDRWASLWSALIHIVRNAIDHGIEAAEERDRIGKALGGRLRLAARRIGEGYCLEIVDDGRGIDWESVRRKCAEMKRPAESRADLVSALLSPGFSTRSDVTETSGRGMGLAALASVVRELSGLLAVHSEPTQGTRWTLTFPNLAPSSVG